MRSWYKSGHPACYWLSGFFFPHGFMTGTLQTFARKHIKPIDLLEFAFKVTSHTDQTKVERAPDDGIYVYGLFIEGAKWSFADQCLEEQAPGEMTF
jgi:dynein heavy chain